MGYDVLSHRTPPLLAVSSVFLLLALVIITPVHRNITNPHTEQRGGAAPAFPLSTSRGSSPPPCDLGDGHQCRIVALLSPPSRYPGGEYSVAAYLVWTWPSVAAAQAFGSGGGGWPARLLPCAYRAARALRFQQGLVSCLATPNGVGLFHQPVFRSSCRPHEQVSWGLIRSGLIVGLLTRFFGWCLYAGDRATGHRSASLAGYRRAL